MPAGVVPATRVRADEESDRPKTSDIVERTARTVEKGSAGMPVGVQVVARHWREDVRAGAHVHPGRAFSRPTRLPYAPDNLIGVLGLVI